MRTLFTGEFFVPGESPRRLEADHMERYRFASRYVAGKSVLDLACGTGYGSYLLANAGAGNVIGCDINDEALDFARGTYIHANLAYRKGDIGSFETVHKYDMVTCFETIEHIEDHESALRQIGRAMVDGGVLIISSPNRPISSPRAKSLDAKPRNSFHVREFTIAELTEILQRHGFCVDGAVYGQRKQPAFGNAILQLLYQKVCKPHLLASSKVVRVRALAPTYFILIAAKKVASIDSGALCS